MEWFVAHAWLTLSVSSPSSENPPDGIAANAVIYGKGNLGPSWVGDEGDGVLDGNVTSDAIRPSSAVFALVCDASADAEITLRRGTRASPGDLVCTLQKCTPANLWIGFSTLTADTSSWYLRIDDSGAIGPSDAVAIEAKFFGIAPRVVLGGGTEGFDIARPAQMRQPTDLSTHATSQLGADFAAEQVTQYALTLQVGSHEDTAAWARLRTAILACKTVRPVLMCADKDRATEYGVAVLGRFTAMPGEPVDLGMMVSGAVSIVEVL